MLGGSIGSAIVKEGIPFTLHFVMFIPALMGQATLEQQAYWVGRSWNCEIIGTYAQVNLILFYFINIGVNVLFYRYYC